MPNISCPWLEMAPSKETLLEPWPSLFTLNVIVLLSGYVNVELEPNVILAEVPLPASELYIFTILLAVPL